MKLAVLIFSWIGVGLGGLSLLGGLFAMPGNKGAGGAIFGGALFFTQGLLAILYLRQN